MLQGHSHRPPWEAWLAHKRLVGWKCYKAGGDKPSRISHSPYLGCLSSITFPPRCGFDLTAAAVRMGVRHTEKPGFFCSIASVHTARLLEPKAFLGRRGNSNSS